MHILDVMDEAMPEPRKEMSAYAPKIETVQIPVKKIGTLIGPGGKVIKKIQEDTGATIEVDCTAPAAVTGITAEPGHNKVDVSWTHSGADVDHSWGNPLTGRRYADRPGKHEVSDAAGPHGAQAGLPGGSGALLPEPQTTRLGQAGKEESNRIHRSRNCRGSVISPRK